MPKSTCARAGLHHACVAQTGAVLVCFLSLVKLTSSKYASRCACACMEAYARAWRVGPHFTAREPGQECRLFEARKLGGLTLHTAKCPRAQQLALRVELVGTASLHHAQSNGVR
eukprot:scaffold16674_cov20-Tisochrysis_lutea.AAC.1